MQIIDQTFIGGIPQLESDGLLSEKFESWHPHSSYLSCSTCHSADHEPGAEIPMQNIKWQFRSQIT